MASLLFYSLLLLAGQALANRFEVVPKRYIVEVEESHHLFARDGSPANIHKRMYGHFEARGLEYESHHEYGSPGVFVGMSVSVKDHSDIQKLRDIPGVRAIHPVRRWTISSPIGSFAKRADLPAYDATNAPASDVLHQITGVAKLHAQGITGKGIKIGILDTGVDYNHPALGKGFGKGFKFVGGHDYVGDKEDIGPPLRPDDDPMDCQGHGTHVAGIVGASPGVGPFNVTGVAPDAELMSYKVSGCASSIDEDSTIAGLLQADQDGNDVITLSLGGPSGWSEDAWSVVASKLAEKGRIVTVAAGNEGSDGAWYASGPASGSEVISVASVDNPTFPLQSFLVGGDVAHDPITYFDILPLTNDTDKPLQIYAFTATTNYACTIAKDVPDLSKVVTVTRLSSKCELEDMLKNLETKNAKTILIYGAKQFGSLDSIVGTDAPITLIPTADGEFLMKQFVANKQVTVTFPKGGRLVNFNQPTGGQISSFSTYGPTFDLLFKPSLAAHGGEILSTYPLSKGGYRLLSGTSMATPYMAGCAALLLQVRGKTPEVARQARNLLQTTAGIVPVNATDDTLQTTIVQGAGLVDAFAAAFTQTYVSPGELLLNDTAHFKGTQEFTVKNLGTAAKKYTVQHFPAGTAISVLPDIFESSPGPVKLAQVFATVELSKTSFTLAPNEATTITAKFTPPTALSEKLLPVYSGFIQIEADGEGDIGKTHVSYMGVAGSLFDQPVLDKSGTLMNVTLPAVIIGVDRQKKPVAQTKPMSFKFDGTEKTPRLFVRLLFGSPKVDIDLVDPSLDLAKLPEKVATIGSLFNETYIYRNILSETPQEGFFSIPLNNNASFVNDTWVPDGSYKVLVRALRVTGDPNNPKHYDTFLSQSLTFQFNQKARDEVTKARDAAKNGDTPFFKKPWFIAIMVVAALATVGAIGVGIFLMNRRKRQSTIPSESPFVPPTMGQAAYTPLSAQQFPQPQSYSYPTYPNTEYRPGGY